MPLGLAYIAAALEAAGRKVHIVDAVATAPKKHTRYIRGFLVGLRFDEIAARIPADCTVAGLSVIFTHEWPAIVQLIKAIKARRPDIAVVLGGEHVTAMPEFCLATSQTDYVVLGEGEETAVALMDAIEKGSDLARLSNIAFRKDASIVVNRRQPRRRPIDEIAPPAWHLFDVGAYNENDFVGGIDIASVSMPMLATRGCPYQCTFCAAPNMWTPSWYARDPICVVDEIERYMKTYGARDFCFQDLTAITRKDWLVAFCSEILRRNLNITWQLPTGTRSEAIDYEVSDLLNRTGMKNMVYAPESGSETTRRLIKKKVKTDRLMDSIDAAVNAKLNVGICMIVGLPHDTPEQLAENLPFLRNVAKRGVVDVSVGFYMALPGTELFYSLYDSGKVVLDRDYFIHILHATALHPSKTYNGSLSKLTLIYWKFRFFWSFYAEGKGFFRSIWRGLQGAFTDSHDSRLAGAVHNAVTSSWQSLKAQFGRRWLSPEQDQAMFREWDAIYRSIRKHNLAVGAAKISPADTTELHRGNVIDVIRLNHETPRQMTIKPDLPSGRADLPLAATA
ncbi:MAG: B12-binding domain-containing radical SAM protein [Rhodospirillales bacterium]|nr:B12-binding domain-containing radical SAM protein [Rhodospirillales bacterium]